MIANTFIAGAPKCGTTSIAQWLASNTEAFVPQVKEPNFFNRKDYFRYVSRIERYQKLFSQAGDSKIRIDATPRYLMSPGAIGNILKAVPCANFIVLVRPPAELAISLHEQEFFSGNEDIAGFEEAWDLQVERSDGRSLPKSCIAPEMLQYQNVASLGSQVQQLYQLVRPEQICLVTLREIKIDDEAVAQRLSSFLGLKNVTSHKLPRANTAKGPRLRLIRSGIIWGRRMKLSLGLTGRQLGILKTLNSINHRARERTRDELNEDFRTRLESELRGEHELLDKYVKMYGKVQHV